jgi:uncharacterized membrane protein YkvI
MDGRLAVQENPSTLPEINSKFPCLPSHSTANIPTTLSMMMMMMMMMIMMTTTTVLITTMTIPLIIIIITIIIKCRKKTETDSSRAVMQGDYTHFHSQVANTVH